MWVGRLLPPTTLKNDKYLKLMEAQRLGWNRKQQMVRPLLLNAADRAMQVLVLALVQVLVAYTGI